MNSGSNPNLNVFGLASSAALTSTTARSVGRKGNHSFSSHSLRAPVWSSVPQASLQTEPSLLFASNAMHRVPRALTLVGVAMLAAA